MNTQEIATLKRLLDIANSDTGQSRRVSDFLLSWWNSSTCGAFDPTDLWAMDHQTACDVLLMIQVISTHHSYPDAFGFGAEFEQLVIQWRPHLIREDA